MYILQTFLFRVIKYYAWVIRNGTAVVKEEGYKCGQKGKDFEKKYHRWQYLYSSQKRTYENKSLIPR